MAGRGVHLVVGEMKASLTRRRLLCPSWRPPSRTQLKGKGSGGDDVRNRGDGSKGKTRKEGSFGDDISERQPVPACSLKQHRDCALLGLLF